MKGLRKPTLPDTLVWAADVSSMGIFASFEYAVMSSLTSGVHFILLKTYTHVSQT